MFPAKRAAPPARPAPAKATGAFGVLCAVAYVLGFFLIGPVLALAALSGIFFLQPLVALGSLALLAGTCWLTAAAWRRV